MITPRSQLVDQQIALHYHLVSRCVRRSWLCGRDPYTRKNYNHRKTWLESRLFHLGDYIEHLRWLSPLQFSENSDDNHARWFARVAAIKKRQSAFGFVDDLKAWDERHGYK